MSSFFNKIRNFFYSLPFGLKAADTEIMGSDASGNGNDTVIKQQVNDKRVAKHLLKGEITQEVKELRYRTYKTAREADNYEYVGFGVAVKKDDESADKKNKGVIRFSQENKLICEDILNELKHIDSYGIERYSVNIDYSIPVRFKMQEFLKVVDVVIKENESPITTLRFDDISNPQEFKSKPFIAELKKLKKLFDDNDIYKLNRNDFASSVIGMSFITFKATNRQPDIVSYTFITPNLIGVKHENGEYKLTYRWKKYKKIDLTDKFFDAELEEKYKNKEKKDIPTPDITIDEANGKNVDDWWYKHYSDVYKCSSCGKDINTFKDGFTIDNVTKKPICLSCYLNHLQNK